MHNTLWQQQDYQFYTDANEVVRIKSMNAKIETHELLIHFVRVSDIPIRLNNRHAECL